MSPPPKYLTVLRAVEKHFMSVPLLRVLFLDLATLKEFDAKMYYEELPPEALTQLQQETLVDLSTRGVAMVSFDNIENEAFEHLLRFLGNAVGVGPIERLKNMGDTYPYDYLALRGETFARCIACDGDDSLEPMTPGAHDKKFFVFIQALSAEEAPIYKRVEIAIARGPAVVGFLNRLILWHNHYN